jgi:hypothetical protein
MTNKVPDPQTTKIPDPHLPIELHLLLGKALHDGRMTVEFAWRTWSFFDSLYFRHEPKDRYHQLAMVSGAGGEATVDRERLTNMQDAVYQPDREGLIGPCGRGMMYLETEAPNSRLNVFFAVRKIRELGYLGSIVLYLYSSGYHLAGLSELRDRLFPVSPFSYVEPGAIVDVINKPTPYLFPTCGIGEYEWLSKVYLIRQGLRLAWENIRGISGVPGDEEKKHSEAERMKTDAFSNLYRDGGMMRVSRPRSPIILPP